jgi:flagellar FliL protein
MANEQASPETVPAVPAPKKRGWLGMSLIALVALGGGGAAAWYFLLAPEDAATELAAAAPEQHGDPIYFSLAENLVVNFRSAGGTRFLQVGIDLMTFDEAGVHAMEKHAPVLRSDLILLLSDQSQDALLSREGKEQLRAEALAEIRNAMTELHGSPVVEALYFTSFVMQ